MNATNLTLTESHWQADAEGLTIDPDITVGAALRAAATEAGDQLALIEGNSTSPDRRRWTYDELLAEAQRCARWLLRHFAPGDRVAIWAPNCPEWVIVEYGAGLAGIVIVTVNPSLQPDEVKYVLSQSESVGVLLVPNVRGNPLEAHLEQVRGDLPALHTVLRLDELLDTIAATADEDAATELPTVNGGDKAQIQYTSGTTGFPKGVVLRHSSLVNNAAVWAHRIGVARGEPWLTPMPLFHTGGCVLAVLGALDRRAPLTLLPGFDPALFLNLIEIDQISFTAGVPTMLIAAMEHPDLEARDLSSLKSVCSGGSQVPEALVRQIEDRLGVDFTIVYGQTECSPVITNTSPDDSLADKGQTIGRPVAHTEVKIVDPESLATVPCDTGGELWARSFATMIGYYNNPEATDATLVEGGWLRTGDLAAMDERGYIRIVGRLKDMIIRGGENLFPVEIEEILHQHPKVAEVAVVGIPDERWGEVVGAVIRPSDAADPPTALELREFTREHLSPQKTPTKWYRIDNFPLTGSGKIRKNVLRDVLVSDEPFDRLP